MRRLLLLFSVVTFLVSVSLSAHADDYTITISGTDSGTLNVVGSTPGGDAGSILLASGSGSINGDSVSLVPAPAGTSSSNPYLDSVSGAGFDDELYPSISPYVDGYGLEFVDAGTYFFLYSAGTGGNPAPPGGATGLEVYSPVDGGTVLSDNPDTFSVVDTSTTPVIPEPSSLMLFGTGILGLAGVARRKLFAVAA